MFHECVSNRRAFSYLRKKREMCDPYYSYVLHQFSIPWPTDLSFPKSWESRHRNYHLRFYIPRAVSNSRIFFVFTGHGRKEEPCLLSTVTQRTLKKKKEKKTTRTSRKCFVSRREWNSIDSIITYRSYSITRHSAKRTPINRSSIFISLFFLLFLISLPLPSPRIISYTEKKVLYTRSTREDIIKHEEGSPSNQEKSIPILGVQIKSCSKRSRSPRRSLKSSSEIRSSPPFPLASGFVRCRARASKLICRDERQQKR